MKNLATILILSTLFLSLFSLSTCASEDIPSQSRKEFTCSVNPVEIFSVVENMPSFGIEENNLSDYISSTINIAEIERIEDGQIRFQVIIWDTGDACLSRSFGTDVPWKSMEGHEELF